MKHSLATVGPVCRLNVYQPARMSSNENFRPGFARRKVNAPIRPVKRLESIGRRPRRPTSCQV